MDEVVPVIKEAEREGWTVTATAKNHRRFTSPEGGIVITSGTPSDVRTIRNLTSRLRREGLELRERSPRERHPSTGGDIEKLVVSGRDLNPRMLEAAIFVLLEDGPLTEGMLVHSLRCEGVKIVASDLTSPLRALVTRGAVKQVGSEYAQGARLRPSRPLKPCPPPTRTRTEGDVWCALRKGAWHSTPHNNRPSVEYRSLCGYLMPTTEEYEQRRPDCPYCLEKLESIVFL